MLKTVKNPMFLVCVFAAVSAPQSAPEFHSKIEIVAVPCAVVDANGSVVPGLTREDFRVYDNFQSRNCTTIELLCLNSGFTG